MNKIILATVILLLSSTIAQAEQNDREPSMTARGILFGIGLGKTYGGPVDTRTVKDCVISVDSNHGIAPKGLRIKLGVTIRSHTIISIVGYKMVRDENEGNDFVRSYVDLLQKEYVVPPTDGDGSGTPRPFHFQEGADLSGPFEYAFTGLHYVLIVRYIETTKMAMIALTYKGATAIREEECQQWQSAHTPDTQEHAQEKEMLRGF